MRSLNRLINISQNQWISQTKCVTDLSVGHITVYQQNEASMRVFPLNSQLQWITISSPKQRSSNAEVMFELAQNKVFLKWVNSHKNQYTCLPFFTSLHRNLFCERSLVPNFWWLPHYVRSFTASNYEVPFFDPYSIPNGSCHVKLPSYSRDMLVMRKKKLASHEHSYH